jgi:two-component system NarL family response regulator
MTIRLVLAHGQAAIREALCRTLSGEPEIEAVAPSGNVAETVAATERLHPDVVIVDLGLPEPGADEAIRRVRALAPASRVVALGHVRDDGYVRSLLRAGATGFVSTNCSLPALVGSILEAAGAQPVAGNGDARAIDGSPRAPSDHAPPRLGRREMQVLKLVTEGHRSAAIASQLAIAPATVDTHRRNIMRKLGVHSVAELTKYAIRSGITSL